MTTLSPVPPVLTRDQVEALRLAVGALAHLGGDDALSEQVRATFVSASVTLSALLTTDQTTRELL